MSKIFVHGLGQTDSSWNEVVNELEDTNCPNLKELLGLKEVTFDNLYEVFCEYCNNFSDKIDLCGISLGGMLSLKYAFNYPNKVNSLVLIGTQYKIPKLLFSLQSLIFRFLPTHIFGDLGFTKRDFIDLTNSMKNIDFSNDLSKIKCKTLIIYGENDTANIKASKNLSVILENSEIEFVKNSKHEVNIDNPEELSKILVRFYN